MATPDLIAPAEDAILWRIARLLFSKPVQKINSRYAAVHITGLRYQNLGLLLTDAKIRVERGQPPPGADAAYDSDNRKFIVRDWAFGGNARERMILVHESTHALVHFANGPIRPLDDEVIAYLASALYNIYDGRQHTPDVEVDDINYTAASVAEKIKDQAGATPDARILQEAIQSSKLYQGRL